MSERRLTFDEWQAARRAMATAGFRGSVADWLSLDGALFRLRPVFQALADAFEAMVPQFQRVAAAIMRGATGEPG